MRYTFGDIFTASLKMFKENIGLYLILAVVLGALSVIPVFFIGDVNAEAFLTGVGTSTSTLDLYANMFNVYPTSYWIMVAVVGILTALINLGIYSFVYFREVDDEKKFMEAFQYGLSRLIPLFLTGLLLAVLNFGLFLLLIVPGVIFAVYWTFTPMVVLFRDKTGLDAMRESKAIVKGSWWRVFGYFFSVGFIVYVLAAIIQFIFSLAYMSFFLFSSAPFIVETLFMFINSFLSSLAAVFVLIFYVGFFLALEFEKKSQDAPQDKPAEKV